jgi:hypothetical protein
VSRRLAIHAQPLVKSCHWLRAACGDVNADGAVKLVARPERVMLLGRVAERDNCLPGMVERTVYVGALPPEASGCSE